MNKESPIKERILDVAGRLFYEQGYNLTGINQVIEEAGIARGSLYNHFASKTDLLLAYIEKVHTDWFAELYAFSQKATTPKQKLLLLFDYRIMRQQRSNFGGCNFIKINAEVSRDEKKVFALVKAHKEQLRAYIKTEVKQLDNKSGLSTDLLTDTLFLLLEGGSIGATIYQDIWALKQGKKIADTLL